MSNSFSTLLNFIKDNKTWKEDLEQAPYCIKVKQCSFINEKGELCYPELYMLSYNMLESTFSEEIVRCCRGSIVSVEDLSNPKMICAPFYKFFNYGESNCAEIDWNSARVLEKVDGILIKLFNYKNKWIWVTNNGWDINQDCPTSLCSSFIEEETKNMKLFGELKDYALEYALGKEKVNAFTDALSKDYTYMFELISPKNRIICDYPNTRLIFLGARSIYNYKEKTTEELKEICPILKSFRSPDKFDLKNMDEVLDLCNSYKDAFHEGVVIVDKDFNRIKIKCEYYLSLKGLKGEIGFTDQKIFESLKSGSIDDAIGAFPELIPQTERVKKTYIQFKNKIENFCKEGLDKYIEFLNETSDVKCAKKLYAEWVFKTNTKYQRLLFEAIKEKSCLLNFINNYSYKEMEEEINAGQKDI